MASALDAELSYNESWIFLQFKCYEMHFEDMKMCIDGILSDNRNPIPCDLDETYDTNFWWKTNDSSNRVKGCVLLQIQITKAQYEEMRIFRPELETGYPQ